MKKYVFALCVAVVAAVSGSGRAEDFKLEKGFVRLDNGKDLAGWTRHKGGEWKDGEWKVVDGAIRLEYKTPPPYGAIYSTLTHSRDVIVRLQFRASHGADSGVFLHGAQFQVRDYANSYAQTRRFAEFAKPAGQWNDLEFNVTDGVAVVSLNGTVISKAWKIGNKRERGVGLQKEKGNFEFRFIRIKEKAE
jgi:hypothetical protein